MRFLFSILTILLVSSATYGQDIRADKPLIERCYTAITTSFGVQSKYIGCYGIQSKLFKKVDSLKNAVGIKDFVRYFDDTSTNLKYYSFVEMLSLDDNSAFDLLKSISEDKRLINFEFAGQFRGQTKLVELLAGEYMGFIKLKYYYGGICVHNGRSYQFDRANRKLWREKQKVLMEMIEQKGLSKKWIDDFSR